MKYRLEYCQKKKNMHSLMRLHAAILDQFIQLLNSNASKLFQKNNMHSANLYYFTIKKIK